LKSAKRIHKMLQDRVNSMIKTIRKIGRKDRARKLVE
jgi:hypothetical protein